VRTFLLIALLALISCTNSCSNSGGPGIQLDSKLKPYLPPNSKFLAGVDLDKIKQTDFFQRHQSELDLPQLNQLPKQIGMDPRRDLSYFVISWTGTGTLILARGNFAKVEKTGKREIVFPSNEIALFGSVPLLESAEKKDGGAISEDLQMQMARLPKSAQIWEATTGIISPNQLAIRSDTASLLSNISGFINGTGVAVTLGSGIALDAHISCISEEGSTRVHDALRGLIGLARLSTKDNELDQLKIWDAIKVDKQAKEVHVTADLPAALADKAIGILKASTSRLR